MQYYHRVIYGRVSYFTMATFLLSNFNVDFFVNCSVEDHDDLTPIFNEQSEALINSYGMGYFIRFSLKARTIADEAYHDNIAIENSQSG